MRDWEKFHENIFIDYLFGKGCPELCYGYQGIKKAIEEKFSSSMENKRN
jgi:hypothetical protein